MSSNYKTPHTNPFTFDPNRGPIWEMLVIRDIEAFVNQDFNMVADDFIAEGFMGYSGERDRDIKNWHIKYLDLESYRKDWLVQAADTAKTADMAKLAAALLELTTLENFNFNDQKNTALVRKEFNGTVPMADGSTDKLSWQTLYACRKVDNRWKISGFIGYLPRPLVP